MTLEEIVRNLLPLQYILLVESCRLTRKSILFYYNYNLTFSCEVIIVLCVQLNHISYICSQSLHIYLLLEIIDLQCFCISRIPCQLTGQYAIKDSPITCRQMDGQKRQQFECINIYWLRRENKKYTNIQLLVPLHYKKAAIKTIPIKEKLPKP